VLLGGRVAEEATVGEISTGAQDDLLTATDLARRMVRELGMSDAMGLSSFDPRRTAPWAGERGAHDYSEATARAVDEEVSRLLGEAQARARLLIAEHKGALGRIARRLLEAETIGGPELKALVREEQPAAT
jgi:cell division protease FtsH